MTDLEKNGVLLLTKAEVQSGLTRQRWAELLILQLPEGHDGRNSWLINYGTSAQAEKKRAAWNAQAKKDGRKQSCAFNPRTSGVGEMALIIDGAPQ